MTNSQSSAGSSCGVNESKPIQQAGLRGHQTADTCIGVASRVPLWQRRMRGKPRPVFSVSKDMKQEHELHRLQSRLAEEFSVVSTVGHGTSSFVQHAIRQ